MTDVANASVLLSGLCLAGAAFGCIYLLVTAFVVLRFPRTEAPARPATAEPVTFLKPLHGAEFGLRQRLSQLCGQDYPGPVQVVCGVAAHTDLATRIVEHCCRAHNAIDLVVDTRRHGSNPKISNLINVLPHARHDILIISDSDIDVKDDYVGKVTAALADTGVGAATCVYYGIALGGLWARLSALAINSHFLPNAIFASTAGLAEPCFGATIALRRSTLQRIGGLAAFKDVLADDFAIGQAVRAQGLRVIIPGFAVGHVCQEASCTALLARELRMARTIRSVDPVGYWGLVLSHPFALAMLALPFSPSSAAMLAGLALACRTAVYLAVKHAFKLPARELWLIPLHELMAFGIFICSLLGRSVQWRGAAYRVAGNGEFLPIADRQDSWTR